MEIYENIASLLKLFPWFESQSVIYFDGLPETPIDAACINLIGGEIERIQNVKGTAAHHYGIEIRVRAKDSDRARTRISFAEELDGIVNVSVNGSFIRSIFQIAPPTIAERDVGGETTYAVSFNVVRRG